MIRITRLLVLLPVFVVSVASVVPARAEEAVVHRGALGIGALATLGGPAGGPFGAAVVYDPGQWHLEGVLGISDANNNTATMFAARGWYHMHSTSSSDFSLGGGFGMRKWGPGDSTVHVEAGAEIRAFIVSNIALGAAVGLGITSGSDGMPDRDGYVFGGQLLGALGITYFFF